MLELYDAYREHTGGRTPYEDFRAGIWYRIAEILAENCEDTPHNVKLQFIHQNDKKVIRVINSSNEELLWYYSQKPDSIRFIERFDHSPDNDTIPLRSTLLKNLAELTISRDEQIMADHGMRSIGQELQSSFWYRLSYHCYREFGHSAITFHPSIEDNTGSFSILGKDTEENTLFRMVIPRRSVERILGVFKDILPNHHGFTIRPIPLKSIFKVSMNTELDLEIRPLIQVLQEGGEEKFFEREELEQFRYGNLVYIREMGILAELERPGRLARKFKAPIRMVLKESQIPAFLDEFKSDLENGSHIVDVSVRNLRIMKRCDRTELVPESLDRDWCWLSVRYSFGNSSISLGEHSVQKEKGIIIYRFPMAGSTVNPRNSAFLIRCSMT